jgi:hypothetical protein
MEVAECTDYQKLAELAVSECANIPDFGWYGDEDLGVTWAFCFSKNRDSGLLEESNFDTVKRIFNDEGFEEGQDWSDVRCNHWAVGWVDYILVRMLDDEGRYTPIAVVALDIRDKLMDYPLLDEEDHSRREFEAQCDCIQDQSPIFLTEDQLGDTFSWFWDHQLIESSDDTGYISLDREDFFRCFDEIGIEYEKDNEDDDA